MNDTTKEPSELPELALWLAYCEKKMDLEEADEEIERLRDQITSLQDELEDAEDEIARLHSGLIRLASQSDTLPGKMFVEFAREVITRSSLRGYEL